MARWGRIDVLVNNVGGSAAGGPVEMSEAVWDAQIDHNLKSVFLGCKHVLPIMAAQGAGAIVNIASTSGLRWTGSAQVAYAATKAGVIQLGKVVAVQYAKQGVRVNTVVPGQLHTPMVETRLAGQRAGGDVQSLLQARQARIPLPFMGDGRDTARAVLFLASDEARFITATEILVDGGAADPALHHCGPFGLPGHGICGLGTNHQSHPHARGVPTRWTGGLCGPHDQ